MAYNLDAIKRKIEDLSGGPKSGKKRQDRPKLTWFKPQIGTYDIRFCPYQDANGQPFQEVSYYDNKLLSERRFVAPAQFGEEDPIFDLLNELRKERSKETWRLIGTLRPRERFYAPILIRGEEDKGVQIWEMNSKILKDVYSVLAHPDYAEDDLMDPENGFDFTLTVTDSGKKWNGYVVKEYDITPRRKPSPLAKTKKAREELLAQVPDLEAYFKSMVRSPEHLSQLVENFLAAREDGNSEDASASSNNASSRKTNGSSSTGETSRGSSSSKAVKNIEDAFADLDDEEDPF